MEFTEATTRGFNQLSFRGFLRVDHPSRRLARAPVVAQTAPKSRVPAVRPPPSTSAAPVMNRGSSEAR